MCIPAAPYWVAPLLGLRVTAGDLLLSATVGDGKQASRRFSSQAGDHWQILWWGLSEKYSTFPGPAYYLMCPLTPSYVEQQRNCTITVTLAEEFPLQESCKFGFQKLNCMNIYWLKHNHAQWLLNISGCHINEKCRLICPHPLHNHSQMKITTLCRQYILISM